VVVVVVVEVVVVEVVVVVVELVVVGVETVVLVVEVVVVGFVVVVIFLVITVVVFDDLSSCSILSLANSFMENSGISSLSGLFSETASCSVASAFVETFFSRQALPATHLSPSKTVPAGQDMGYASHTHCFGFSATL